ncbi:CD209 antigen-like isoform X1 [Oncorhynchus clarkii lewisi]|uniref:CD209 antigen-like isoform X1 n=1 Tax=Oncorhynchus clarkii lewisi TaxID=490388 RepID=UPI0039B88FB7
MSEGVYENSERFKDDEPDAMKNTDMDGQLYANVRDFKPRPRDGVVASVHVQWWKRPSGVAAVCLGLLCVLLLAGIIGLAVYYGVSSHRDSTERDLLQASYSLLTKERDQLQTSYNNMTEEKYHLQTSYNSMTEERDQLQTSYSLLTNKRDQLQTSYNKITEEKDQLQTSYNNLTEERDQLQTRVRLSEEPCLAEWWKFGTSCYYVSSTMNTAGAGQKECRTMGGELVVINSREEQVLLQVVCHCEDDQLSILSPCSAVLGVSQYGHGNLLPWPHLQSSCLLAACLRYSLTDLRRMSGLVFIKKTESGSGLTAHHLQLRIGWKGNLIT